MKTVKYCGVVSNGEGTKAKSSTRESARVGAIGEFQGHETYINYQPGLNTTARSPGQNASNCRMRSTTITQEQK